MATDYVIELAEESLRQRLGAKGVLIEKILSSFTPKPDDAASLASMLEPLPQIQAQLASITGYTPSQWLLGCELEEVAKRRAKVGVDAPVPSASSSNIYGRAMEAGLIGLCFSGGGIRSASFNLGVLQGLAELKLLKCFDYLSSVSGGGYIHQWLAAWSKRRGFDAVIQQLIPLPEKDNPGTHPEPIRWLRRYSNYVTPQVGLLSADTWVAVATWVRNTLLNQLIVISGLFVLILLPHILAFESLVPQNAPTAAFVIGGIFCLSLLATKEVAKNLRLLSGPGSDEQKAFGQFAVQKWIVAPLFLASLLLSFLMRMISAAPFGVNLVIVFLGSTILLLVLALAIIFAGDVPLSFLKSHQNTSHYKSVREFWQVRPKCFVHVKFVFVLCGLGIAALFTAISGAVWIAGSIVFVSCLWSYSGWLWWRTVLALLPPLVLAGSLLTMLLLLGLLGRAFLDERREWLSRLAAWMGLYSLGWVFFSAFSFFAHSSVLLLRHKLIAGVSAALAWIATSAGGLFAGKNSKSSGATDYKAPSTFNAIELLAIVGPYAFIAGLALLLGALAEYFLSSALAAGPLSVALTFIAPLVVCFLFAWRVDINDFSMHAFYRNRLARCYLGASNFDRKPNPFTGFDADDTNIAVSDLLPGDKNKEGYAGPFPIFCSALNLTFGEDLAWQERKAASFVFTPLYSGYDVGWTAARTKTNLRFNGYVKTLNYAYPSPGVHVSTAVAISGAALSPNWGYHTNPATAFLLTVFNARLGWWLRNPRTLNDDGTKLRLGEDIREDGKLGLLRDPRPWPSPRFSLFSLIRELLAQTNDMSNYVYLTDGGHFDNMGLYELVRRHCRYIVICDAEEDGKVEFGGIGMAIRKCRIDFGAEINLDLRPLTHIGDTQLSTSHCVTGTIRYPEDPAHTGTVVYIKSSLTGDEPSDVMNYKKEHPVFPHDSTVNQWFTESQFESYRRLGHHVAYSVFEPATPDRLPCETLEGRSRYFSNLRHVWCAPTPEMEQYGSAHTERYVALLAQVRNDANLPDFFDMLFVPGDGKWKKGREADQVKHAVRFSYDLIEFIWTIFMELNLVLPANRSHPHARGWCLMFKEWAKIDVVQESWLKYRETFSQRFRNFVENGAIGLPTPPTAVPTGTTKAPGA